MHRHAAILTLTLCLVVAKPTKVFKGAWFTIAYPASFVATGSMKSATSDGFDSAYFRDRMGRVEFYVFSPQAGGEPADLKRELAGERLQKETGTRSAERNVRWATYAAPDGAHLRSVEELRTTDLLQVRVFAIKYRAPADLAAHRSAYEKFKKSFEAFAD